MKLIWETGRNLIYSGNIKACHSLLILTRVLCDATGIHIHLSGNLANMHIYEEMNERKSFITGKSEI